MTRYYFDPSALVKRYHTEAGTPAVDATFAEPGAAFVISRLAIVECVSAFCLKARTGEVLASEVPAMRRSLLADVGKRILLVSRLLVRHLTIADSLLMRHAPARRLRTLDAVHLAVALDLHLQHRIDVFVSADAFQCEIAKLEGLAISNPMASVP